MGENVSLMNAAIEINRSHQLFCPGMNWAASLNNSLSPLLVRCSNPTPKVNIATQELKICRKFQTLIKLLLVLFLKCLTAFPLHMLAHCVEYGTFS